MSNLEDARTGDSEINDIFEMAGNYWGTTDEDEIADSIFDYYDSFTVAKINFQPFLTQPSADSPPQVVSLATAPAGPLGAGPAAFTVAFNCDMDTSVAPQVTFGPAEPYTDHTISGAWLDARTWVGAYDVTSMTGDGWHYISVGNARDAAHWMPLTNDYRFKFEIITSGTAAMNLQATGGEGYVDLSWTQDDFDLLAGYNLYRSTSSGGTYERINAGLIPADQKTYRDSAVNPGQTYFYKFTVVKTDMTESGFSNVAAGTPTDTVIPVIAHTPIVEAPPGLPLSIAADITDNVAVQSAKLFFRKTGTTPYSEKAMTKTTGDRYSATIEGSQVASPGIDYYIEASDGVNTARDGRAENPHQVAVVDKPVVTSVAPNSGPDTGGTPVTVAGSNFKAGASVTFGGAVASNVVVVSSSQITCETPPHFAIVVDVTVINPDTQSGTLLRGFTYLSDEASVSMPNVEAGQLDIITVPINAANINGLAAADILVTFDAAILAARTAATGSLTPGWGLAANTSLPGQISISMASSAGTVTGGGVLANIEFEVTGAPGTLSVLHLQTVNLNGGAIGVQTADGSVHVADVYDVSGRVAYRDTADGVPGVTLTLTDGRVYTGISAADGTYAVQGARQGDYDLFPEFSGLANGITAYDGSLTLQHAAGVIQLTGHAATAGDVDASGTINSVDAFYILQKAVDLIPLPFPGSGRVWAFDPAQRSYANLSSDQTEQDFAGILLGDVSGNWSEAAFGDSGAETQCEAQVKVRLDPTADPNRMLATVWLNPLLTEVLSLDLRLLYGPAKASVLSIDKQDYIQDWQSAHNSSTPGEIRIAAAGADPILRETGGMFLIEFSLLTPDRDILLRPGGCLINEQLAEAVFTPSVRGTITTDAGKKLRDVTLSFLDGGGAANTGQDGEFFHYVDLDWTGTITPQLEGFSFTPSAMPIGPVTFNTTGHDFTASFICTTLGDVNGDQTITPGDAQRAFEIYMGIWVPDLCEGITADANCSSDCTPQDAQWIFEHYLGKRVLPDDCHSVGEQRTKAAYPAASGSVEIGEPSFEAGDIVTVPILLRDAAGLKSFGLDVEYDSENLSFLGVNKGDLGQRFIEAGGHRMAENVVRIGGYSADAVTHSGDGVLVFLRFRVRKRGLMNLRLKNLVDDIRK